MSKFFNAMIGLIVGDALGVPYEFKTRDTFKAVDMIGYGTHYQPPGTWSDDSSLTLCTVESLARCGKVDLADTMNTFADWYMFGHMTPHGKVFDIGGTTRNAIINYLNGIPAHLCGGTSNRDNGNGSLMRILPFAFTMSSFNDAGNIVDVSALTHAHYISYNACFLYCSIARGLLCGVEKNGILNVLIKNPAEAPFNRLKLLGVLSRDEIKSTGYVVDTLEAALWCFLKTDSYKECVLMAVNLGGDTDTIAAVAGGLAGIYYGIGGTDGIPEKWIAQIAKLDEIKELCGKFEARFGAGANNGNKA